MKFKIKTYIIVTLVTLIFALSLRSFILWDIARIDEAKDRCKVICDEGNYDCRNKCFRYEYYGD